MKKDLEISRDAKKLNIKEIAQSISILEDELYLYGNEIAKIDLGLLDRLKSKENGKLILVSAISPTPYGEGKTTMSIGISDGLKRLGKNVVAALREPSMGPVLGLKGSATGGGYAQVVPRDKINLHFTGDLHAITSAHNFISAVIENHIYYGNSLNINKIVWPRALDINDRSLRNIKVNDSDSSFIITAASEIMAVFCLSNSLEDLKYRLGEIIVAYNINNKEIYVKDLEILDSLVVILKDALKPNLVQTLENTPVIIHGGPFANIAHGCNSVIATQMALKVADFTVTEAGFGSDLGLEKFMNIKVRTLGKSPDLVVLVSTLKALKYHGLVDQGAQSFQALKKGIESNLMRHLKILKSFNIPYIIGINHFEDDPKEEIDYIINWANENNHVISFIDSFTKGSQGALDIAEKVIKLSNSNAKLNYTYNINDDLFTKTKKIATTIYGSSEVIYSKKAESKLLEFNNKYSNYPICIAKTPLSFSTNASLRTNITKYDLEISDVRVSNGAGFVVLLTKGVITMPGLPERPNAIDIKLDKDNNVIGKL